MIADEELGGGPRPISVTGGSIRGALGYDQKTVNGKKVYKRYRVQVVPISGRDVTISITPPGSCETKSFCTPSGDKLSNTLTKTVRARPGGSPPSAEPVPGPVRDLSASQRSQGRPVSMLWKHPAGNLGVQYYKVWHSYGCGSGGTTRHHKVYSPNGGESYITFTWRGGRGREFSVAAMGNHGIGACKNVRAKWRT